MLQRFRHPAIGWLQIVVMVFWTFLPPMRTGRADPPPHGGYDNTVYNVAPNASSPGVSFGNYLANQQAFDDWLAQQNAADVSYSYGFSCMIITP